MNYAQIKAMLTNALMNGDIQTASNILAQLGIDPNIALTYMNAITPRIQGEIPTNNLFDLLGINNRVYQPSPIQQQQQTQPSLFAPPQPSTPYFTTIQPTPPQPPSSPRRLNLKTSNPRVPNTNRSLYWQPAQATNTTSNKRDFISLLGI